MSSNKFDDFLLQQLQEEEDGLAAANAGDDDDDDDDGDDDDGSGDDVEDDAELVKLSDAELLTRARDCAAIGDFDGACNTYSYVLERRRDAGESDLSTANAVVYLAYGSALYRNAVKSIDALGQTIVSAGVDNLQSNTVKEQLVAHGGTAMEDLELAFQILECARNAFEEHNEPAFTSDLANTYMLLAEVHLENDNFGDGRADLHKAFDIESKAPGGPRVQFLADVLIKIAVSFLSDKKKPDAMPHLTKAKALLQAAIDGAQQTNDTTGVAATSSNVQSSGKAQASIHDPKTLTADDVKSLQATLADVDAKIAECEPEPQVDSAAAASTTAATSSSAPPPPRNAFDAPLNTEARVENLGVLGGMRVKRKSDAISSESKTVAATSSSTSAATTTATTTATAAATTAMSTTQQASNGH